ncbi:conserved Plasmodium protein, unknown function [Plasmodium gallinaceum]|uniref:Uncharacterized protein n=1 Tax=Plasmodium gallinaceum TaxID=5849 RepID=A0A1J1H1V5_PLAGA|nr:conserved Plasmodium protein, unknown function [Plasmodium gallinaceum]CRG97515.1 conserved Plasmodium protein, unknown function [Plasmodium gallinaceum]
MATVISPVVTVQQAPVVYTTYKVVPQTVVYTLPSAVPVVKNVQVIPTQPVCLAYAYTTPMTVII